MSLNVSWPLPLTWTGLSSSRLGSLSCLHSAIGSARHWLVWDGHGWGESPLFHLACCLPTGWFVLVHRWWQGHERKDIIVQGLL